MEQEVVVMDEDLAGAAMPGLYTACQALVHPYRGEGLGMPILEARPRACRSRRPGTAPASTI